jgi:uncharacterized metal-binding protein
MTDQNPPKTLVYSCSGCSSAAQLANYLAVRLDREGHAQMSCIAGVGGNVRSLVRKLDEAVQSERPILATRVRHQNAKFRDFRHGASTKSTT